MSSKEPASSRSCFRSKCLTSDPIARESRRRSEVEQPRMSRRSDACNLYTNEAEQQAKREDERQNPYASKKVSKVEQPRRSRRSDACNLYTCKAMKPKSNDEKRR
ncbi:hypothetical protein KFK09_022088 [Dendrobium nobile]|uniref:Uncharacterized protein n=1 Tax=Dendrobium nobile TaxID=94219 RepID=A0A8T3ANM9_DENNO|nr:hypothetical protein KFK09_022088 [Dendrobium nobile]